MPNPILFSLICEPNFVVILSTTGSQELGGETRCGVCSGLGTVLVSDVMEPGDQRGGEISGEWLPRGLGQCWWTTQDCEGKEEHGACGHVEWGGWRESGREQSTPNSLETGSENVTL